MATLYVNVVCKCSWTKHLNAFSEVLCCSSGGGRMDKDEWGGEKTLKNYEDVWWF